MATTINGTTGRNASYWKYYLVCTETDVVTASNTSKLKVDVYLGATSYSRAVRGAVSATHTVNVNGTNYTFTTGAYTIEKNTNILLGSITTNAITHNDDGSKSVSVSASSPDLAQASGYGPYSGSASGTVTLTTIERYANLTSLSVKSKTVNSITLQYTTDRNAWLFAKLNNGDWLNDGEPFKSNTTSGTFTIYYKDRASTTKLDPNTKYTITVLCRALNRDSGLDTQKNIEATTYDIAKLVSVPDVNIGSKQTITWTNPSGATTTLKLAKTDNTQIANIGTVTGTSKDYTPTASTIYALTPNSNTYKARYIITTTANNQSYTNAKDFTFKVTNSNPTFTTYTYKNINTTSYNGNKLDTLTGNNQILVKGYSNVQVDITTANKAVAKNSATMSTYKLVLGSKSQTKDYSSSATVSLTASAIDSNVMTVYATDSRGNSTSIAKTLSSSYYKEYTIPVIKSVTATRSNNGVGKGVTLAYSGTFWNASFGSVTNTIGSVTYQYKQTSASSWSSAVTLTPTISSSNYSGSASIQGDLGAEGFDVSKSYNIRLTVKDKLATKTYDIVLGSGTPAIAVSEDNVAIGQKYDTSEGSKLQVNGNINLTNDGAYIRFKGVNTIQKTGTAVVIGASNGNIVLRPKGTSDNTNQAYLSSDGTFTAPKFNGPATKVYGTMTDPTDEVTYGIPFHANVSSGNKDLRNNNGLIYMTREGTTSVGGYGLLRLGNGTATGTAGNKCGMLRVYSYKSGYTNLRYIDTTNNTNHYLPAHSGTLGSRTNLYNNSTGTNGTVTLSETSANFSYLDIYYYKTESDMGGKIYSMVRVYAPNGKIATLANTHVATNTIMQVLTKLVSISGTSITVKKEMLANFTTNTTTVSECTTPSPTQTYIVRVDGWE